MYKDRLWLVNMEKLRAVASCEDMEIHDFEEHMVEYDVIAPVGQVDVERKILRFYPSSLNLPKVKDETLDFSNTEE